MKTSIESALTFGAASVGNGLATALSKGRVGTLAEIAASGLEGRAGVASDAGTRWNLVAASRADARFVVCDAATGGPGLFKDRVVLADHADLVLEGMTLCAFAVDARQGYIHLRAEYAWMAQDLETTLRRRRESGLLGAGIGGRAGFDFDVELRIAPSAGLPRAESAVNATIEGRRGESRAPGAAPVDPLLLGRPTVVDDPETFAWAAFILDRGADWFRTVERDRWIGRRVVSVSGDCERPGLYELPRDATVADCAARVGGDGAAAARVGGPAGRWVPAAAFKATLVCGDGGAASVVFAGPARNLWALATADLDAFVAGSCGQCTPCREGLPLLRDTAAGLAKAGQNERDLARAERLCATLADASLCDHGRTSARAVRSLANPNGGDHV